MTQVEFAVLDLLDRVMALEAALAREVAAREACDAALRVALRQMATQGAQIEAARTRTEHVAQHLRGLGLARKGAA